MAQRTETAKRKQDLLAELRALHSSGRARAGGAVPSLRELSEKFGLSTRIIGQELDSLAAEGVLHKVPRVGTFFGQPRVPDFEFYLLVLPRRAGEYGDSNDFFGSLQNGFEERIAQLGGPSLSMTQRAALDALERGALPPLAGVFNFGQHPLNRGWKPIPDVPQVCFEGMIEDAEHTDVVGFDDVAGGRLATSHLLQQGHRRVAFIGLHRPECIEGMQWSADREQGWREAVEGVEKADGLALHTLPSPLAQPSGSRFWVEGQSRMGCEIVAPHLQAHGLILAGAPVSAVVAANDAVALGVLEALRGAKVPHQHWPALVGFDNLPCASGHILSSMRLPWEELGRVAADLLWARKHGELCGAPVRRDIQMRLIPRLTCRTEWSNQPGPLSLAVA